MTPVAEKNARDRGRIPIVVALVVASVAVVLLVSLVFALYVSAKPGFFGRYRGMAQQYATLQTSAHKGLPCSDCHLDKRGPVAYRLALVGDFYRSLFVKDRMPTFTRMAEPTRAQCLKCHEQDWSMDAKRTALVPHPAHLRVSTEPRACVTCHRWTAHEETYMTKHRAMPFSTVCAYFGCHVGWKQPNQCPTCHHILTASSAGWIRVHPQTVRANGPNGCLESCHDVTQCRTCHTTGKTPAFNTTRAQATVRAIEVLHVKPNWVSQLHGKQALLDQSRCFVCHQSVGECQACHSQRPAFHGSTDTWIGRHKTVAKDNTRRCLECHKAVFCRNCHAQFKAMR